MSMTTKNGGATADVPLEFAEYYHDAMLWEFRSFESGGSEAMETSGEELGEEFYFGPLLSSSDDDLFSWDGDEDEDEEMEDAEDDDDDDDDDTEMEEPDEDEDLLAQYEEGPSELDSDGDDADDKAESSFEEADVNFPWHDSLLAVYQLVRRTLSSPMTRHPVRPQCFSKPIMPLVGIFVNLALDQLNEALI